MLEGIFKNTVVRMIVALVTVGVISGVCLVFVYNYATPKIKINMEKETESAIKEIFPDSGKIKKTGEKGISEISDKKGKMIGYAFTAEGNGYQGLIKVIVGVDPKMTKMLGMQVLESQETPGLGAEIASKPFRQQFVGLVITHAIEYVRNKKPEQPYQIEALTGATISSRAVVNLLNKRIEEVRKILKVG